VGAKRLRQVRLWSKAAKSPLRPTVRLPGSDRIAGHRWGRFVPILLQSLFWCDAEFFRTADAFRARRYEGPHRLLHKNDRESFVSALRTIAIAELAKNQLCEISASFDFDFCNKSCQSRHRQVRTPAPLRLSTNRSQNSSPDARHAATMFQGACQVRQFIVSRNPHPAEVRGFNTAGNPPLRSGTSARPQGGDSVEEPVRGRNETG